MTPIILGGFNAAGITALTSTHSTSHSSPSTRLMFKNRLSAPHTTSLPSPAMHTAAFISSFLPTPFHAEIPLGQPDVALWSTPLPSYSRNRKVPFLNLEIFLPIKLSARCGKIKTRKLKSGFFSLPQHLVCPDQPNLVLHGVRRKRGCAGECWSCGCRG